MIIHQARLILDIYITDLDELVPNIVTADS